MRVLEPIYERRFIFDSYACRRGKGTHRAIDRAQRYMRRYPYYLKTDIVRFFPSVDHQVLQDLLQKTIRDGRTISLIGQIIDSGKGVLEDEAPPTYFPGDDLLSLLRPKGLPIGNLTSQFFANVLLDVLDHFVKEELRVGGYVRYADDLLLFGRGKRELWAIADRLKARLAEIRLKLHPGKTHLRPSSAGVGFLGFRIDRDQLRVGQQSLRRFHSRRRRLQRAFADGEVDTADVRRSLLAWVAHKS